MLGHQQVSALTLIYNVVTVVLREIADEPLAANVRCRFQILAVPWCLISCGWIKCINIIIWWSSAFSWCQKKWMSIFNFHATVQNSYMSWRPFRLFRQFLSCNAFHCISSVIVKLKFRYTFMNLSFIWGCCASETLCNASHIIQCAFNVHIYNTTGCQYDH